jgi:hypothetical protein
MNAAELSAERNRLEQRQRDMLDRCVAQARELSPLELMVFDRIDKAVDAIAQQERALLPRCHSCGQTIAS